MANTTSGYIHSTDCCKVVDCKLLLCTRRRSCGRRRRLPKRGQVKEAIVISVLKIIVSALSVGKTSSRSKTHDSTDRMKEFQLNDRQLAYCACIPMVFVKLKNKKELR